ncbi:MAG TPA: hypothetical protein VGC13_03270 [Longimicrobium sp.]|jgi:hypothetical protein
MNKMSLQIEELDVEPFAIPGGVEETAPNAALAYDDGFLIVSCFCSADC